MTRYSISLALCIGLVSLSVNADVVHSTDFEADGAAQGAGFNIQPSSMNFTDGGGDHAGQSGLGLSIANPNSGSYSYVIDAGATVDNANGWGGTWSGTSTVDAQNSGGFTTQADATANGSGSYIAYAPGAKFDLSAAIATDAANPLMGGATAAVRLEFYYDIDNDGDGIGNFTTERTDVLPRVGGNGFDKDSIMSTYQTSAATYTFTAADLDFASIVAPDPDGADDIAGTVDDEVVVGFNRVVGVLGSDGHGFDASASGLILYDDLMLEVSGEHVVTVPEPGSIALILAGMLSFCGLVRRKRS